MNFDTKIFERRRPCEFTFAERTAIDSARWNASLDGGDELETIARE
jgi:hypothetical protein